MHRAIQYGDSKTGVTIMFMANKMDSGDILSQKAIPISENDNVKTLEKKLSEIGSDLLIETLDKIDQIIPVKQDVNKVTFAYNIKPEEEKISFELPAIDIRNHVRGFNPWPLTYCVIDGLKLKLYEVEAVKDNLNKNIGEVVKINKNGVYIQTLNGLIILKEVQLQGKKRMKINDFMNGIGKALLILGKKFD